jgi:hypothetical protein
MTMISASEAIHETEMTDWMTIDPQVVSKLLYIDTSWNHNRPAAILTRFRHKTIDRTSRMASAQSPLAGLSPACHLLLEAKANKGRSYGDRFPRYAQSLLISVFDQVLLSRRSLRASTSRKSGPPPCSTVRPRYARPISLERYVSLTVIYVRSQPSSDDLAKLGEVLGLDKEQLKSSFGDHHMVHRGETWTWPPKVSRPSSIPAMPT